MANSIRDTLDGTQGYQISYRPTLAHRASEARLRDTLPYLTSASASFWEKRTAAAAVTAALKYCERGRWAPCYEPTPRSLDSRDDPPRRTPSRLGGGHSHDSTPRTRVTPAG